MSKAVGANFRYSEASQNVTVIYPTHANVSFGVAIIVHFGSFFATLNIPNVSSGGTSQQTVGFPYVPFSYLLLRKCG